MGTMGTALPRVVSREEWESAREELLREEKALTSARDALNAKRRRLPMVALTQEYVFTGEHGPVNLLELFEGRRQLIVYHHMLRPSDPDPCSGCSMFVDNVGHLAHLHARDTTMVLVSRAPIEEIVAFKQRMGWTIPWYSSQDSFARDVGAPGGFALNVFLRDGGRAFHTYSTAQRGVEYLGTTWSLLDATPFGRQENWEDSPEEWPQSAPYAWWRLHDEYDATTPGRSEGSR